MKQWLALVFAVAIGGCTPTLDDYGAPGSLPDKKQQDYAACQLDAQKASQGGSAFIIGDTYRWAMNSCMRSKGYATN